MQDLIDVVKNITQKSVSIQSEGIRRPHEVMETRADISKAKSMLGYDPKIQFYEGIHMLINQFV